MFYSIKAVYDTGDSFHTYTTDVILAPQWESLEQAKKALQWLTEHHKYVKVEQYSQRDWTIECPDVDLTTLNQKPWYRCLSSRYGDYWINTAFVESDTGSLITTDIPYHGHFESLLSLEIINDSNDMRVEF